MRSAPAFFTATLAMLTALAYLFLSLFIFFLYSLSFFIHAPWKKCGPGCTAVGAIPDAMLIVLGWTSAGGALNSHALLPALPVIHNARVRVA